MSAVKQSTASSPSQPVSTTTATTTTIQSQRKVLYDLCLKRAILFSQAKEYTSALHEYDDALQLATKPGYLTHALLCRGICLRNLSRFDEAIHDLTSAIESNCLNTQYHARALSDRAYCHLQLAQRQSAKADLVQAVKLQPQNVESLKSLATVSYQLGEYESAAKYFAKLMQLDGIATETEIADAEANYRIASKQAAAHKQTKIHKNDATRFDGLFSNVLESAGIVFPDEVESSSESAAETPEPLMQHAASSQPTRVIVVPAKIDVTPKKRKLSMQKTRPNENHH